MSIESRAIRQYAELIRAGHLIELDSNQFSEKTAQDLETLLGVTRKSGGPIAKTLDRFALVLNAREQASLELKLAVAGPKASSRLVISLPFLVFLGAGIAGIPIVRVLAAPSLVWLSLVLGGAMFWLGSKWTNRILKRAEPQDSDPGLNLDAVAIAIQAGLPLNVAKDLTGATETDDLQNMSQSSGVALANLITERADALRLEQFNADRLKIQKASVAVLWPLGLTVLPAFVLIAIVPIGAALIQTQ